MDAKKAALYIKEGIEKIPDVAIMIDSGMVKFKEEIEELKIIPYESIPFFKNTDCIDNEDEGKIVIGKLKDIDIIIFCGRHYYHEGHTMDEILFPIYVIKELGIKNIIISQKASSLNKRYTPGDLMITRDHFSLFSPPILRGKKISYLNMKNCYSPELIEKAKLATIELKIDVKLGEFAFIVGPMAQTPYENRVLMNMGVDAVGMTGIPEAVCAHFLGLDILSVCAITNMGEGVDEEAQLDDDFGIVDIIRKIENNFLLFIKSFLGQLH